MRQHHRHQTDHSPTWHPHSAPTPHPQLWLLSAPRPSGGVAGWRGQKVGRLMRWVWFTRAGLAWRSSWPQLSGSWLSRRLARGRQSLFRPWGGQSLEVHSFQAQGRFEQTHWVSGWETCGGRSVQLRSAVCQEADHSINHLSSPSH